MKIELVARNEPGTKTRTRIEVADGRRADMKMALRDQRGSAAILAQFSGRGIRRPVLGLITPNEPPSPAGSKPFYTVVTRRVPVNGPPPEPNNSGPSAA